MAGCVCEGHMWRERESKKKRQRQRDGERKRERGGKKGGRERQEEKTERQKTERQRDGITPSPLKRAYSRACVVVSPSYRGSRARRCYDIDVGVCVRTFRICVRSSLRTSERACMRVRACTRANVCACACVLVCLCACGHVCLCVGWVRLVVRALVLSRMRVCARVRVYVVFALLPLVSLLRNAVVEQV